MFPCFHEFRVLSSRCGEIACGFTAASHPVKTETGIRSFCKGGLVGRVSTAEVASLEKNEAFGFTYRTNL